MNLKNKFIQGLFCKFEQEVKLFIRTGYLAAITLLQNFLRKVFS